MPKQEWVVVDGCYCEFCKLKSSGLPIGVVSAEKYHDVWLCHNVYCAGRFGE